MPSPRGAAYVGDTIALLTGAKGDGYEVLEAQAHAKKLPRGALAGNRFAIRVRDVAAAGGDVRGAASGGTTGADLHDVTAQGSAGADHRDVASLDAAIATRIAAIARDGLPNFFGPQRFGRDGANLRKISPNLSAVHPRERTYVLSAARSLVFNAALAERVKDGTWCRLEVGDVANLDGKGSVFPVDTVDDALTARIAALDVHPTGPMWGKGELMSHGRVRDLEARVASELAEPCELVIAAGMNQERRALRLAVRELSWERQGTDVVVRFWLTKGSFATTVVGELFETGAVDEEG